MKPIAEFNTKLPKLNLNETKVLKLLVEAAKLIVPIYELQENSKILGANFYPKGVSKASIEKEAKKNLEILSPYTVVEKQGSKLIAIPYHVKYAELLQPVVNRLLEAAKLTENKEFGKRLEIQAKALLDGTYDEAAISWMSMKQYILDINIGPVERYDDKLFFVKTSYQAWVGVMDGVNSARVNTYKEIILSSRRKVLMASEKVDYYDKVQTRVDNVVIFAGLIARAQFIGVNLPNDVTLMEKYGSEITIFKEISDFRFKTYVWPSFEKIFSKEFKKLFTTNGVSEGHLYAVVLHELAHTFLRYRNSEKNLQDLFPIIDELSASVMGIKVCGSLLLKDILTQKQLESIMVAFTARCFSMALWEKDDPAKYHYTMGATIFLNYLFETGAIKEAGGISWPNFTKMFVSLDELASVLERLLSQGNRADAEAFIRRYGDSKKLKKLTTL